jgi:hypothetical protein
VAVRPSVLASGNHENDNLSVLVEGRACGRWASCVPDRLHMVPHPGRLSTYIGLMDSSVNPSWCILHVPWSPMACATVRRSAFTYVLARSRLDRELRDGDCRRRIAQRGRASSIIAGLNPPNAQPACCVMRAIAIGSIPLHRTVGEVCNRFQDLAPGLPCEDESEGIRYRRKRGHESIQRYPVCGA